MTQIQDSKIRQSFPTKFNHLQMELEISNLGLHLHISTWLWTAAAVVAAQEVSAVPRRSAPV